jgi:hypothetical protein
MDAEPHLGEKSFNLGSGDFKACTLPEHWLVLAGSVVITLSWTKKQRVAINFLQACLQWKHLRLGFSMSAVTTGLQCKFLNVFLYFQWLRMMHGNLRCPLAVNVL